MARTKFVLRVPSEHSSQQYVSFHVFDSRRREWGTGWLLGAFPRYSAQFDSRELAQKCVETWASSSQPLPDNVVIEEFTHAE